MRRFSSSAVSVIETVTIVYDTEGHAHGRPAALHYTTLGKDTRDRCPGLDSAPWHPAPYGLWWKSRPWSAHAVRRPWHHTLLQRHRSTTHGPARWSGQLDPTCSIRRSPAMIMTPSVRKLALTV